MSRAHVIVFDVNETLSDMSPMAARFVEVGVPAELARLWFTALQRDGFALAATGNTARFADVGAETLAVFLASCGVPGAEGAARRLVSSLAQLPLHPDVPEGIHALRAGGHRIVALTNGSARTTERLLTTAGIREEFEHLLSVEDAPAWKPHVSAYRYAAEHCGTSEDEMVLVGVHPWDIHGAARAGLRTAWVNRQHAAYPSYFVQPDITVASLADLAAAVDKLH